MISSCGVPADCWPRGERLAGESSGKFYQHLHDIKMIIRLHDSSASLCRLQREKVTGDYIEADRRGDQVRLLKRYVVGVLRSYRSSRSAELFRGRYLYTASVPCGD